MAASTMAITCDIDFDRPGKQVSHLGLDHSDNAHAFGVIPIPIAVIANGKGPTVLLSAGNHGDEYEGQVILSQIFVAFHSISSGCMECLSGKGAR